jgi:hypoxanthine phosphoribosyltransferase
MQVTVHELAAIHWWFDDATDQPMAQSASIRSYSWAEVIEFAAGLGDRVRQLEARPTVIVAILRGGAFPGLMLSHDLGVRQLYTLTVRSTVDETPRGARHTMQKVAGTNALPNLSAEDVLVVDDVTNTGRTLTAAVGAIQDARHPRSITTGCLVWDTVPPVGSAVPMPCMADLWIDTVNAWAHFPWEGAPRVATEQESASIGVLGTAIVRLEKA